MAYSTVLQIECCVCGGYIGAKDGGGQTGLTSGICGVKCGITMLPPDLHDEYRLAMTAREAA